MKKFNILIIMLFAAVITASAASKTKLYVNPGHGGYTSNDRQTTMPAVNGVKLPVGSNGYNKSNCFWESSGNTYRALGVKYFWEKRVNSNIKLSRSTNSQDGDLTLSTISAAASSYGGYFMSLHTNAGNASANYMIVMCRSISKSNYGAYSSTSLAMSKAAANWHDYVKLTSVTYSTPRGMTDRQFYSGSSLGVLNTNTAPGYLAESWFHDYRPEAFRLCSEGYNYFLAWQLMRAYLESPGLDVNIYPIIVGDIRDVSKSCGYTSYKTRERDRYLAINGATVTLRNVATGGTKTYTTDQFNNGFYTFYDCVDGATYDITVEKQGYKTVTKTVTVGANGKGSQHKVNFDLEEGTNSGISVSPSSVDFGEITAETTDTKTITVSGTDLSSAITVSSSNTTEFAISTTSIAKTGGSLTITYKPSSAGSHSTTITLTSGNHKKTVVVSGSAKNPPLTFTEGWNYSETSAKNQSWTSDKSKIRNMAFGAGKLYVVNAADGKILIIKAQTGEQLGELNMSGVSGGTLKVMDVNYLDGKIIATNLATTAEGENELKVYVWDNDDATPWVLLNTTNIGGTVRLGDTFNISGDLTNGALFFAEGKADTDTKVVSYTISNNKASATPSVLTVTEDGSVGVQFGLSPRVIPEANGKFWCVGQNYYPTLFDPDGLVMASIKSSSLNEECAGNTFKAFSFKGTSYALATSYEYNATTSERLRKGRAVLLDGTNGWAEADKVGEYPSAGLGTTRNTSMSSDIEVAVNGTSGVEMWVLVHNQGIAYYKHGIVPTYSYEKVPTISVPAELKISTQEKVANSAKISVSAQMLTENITVALSGNSAFAIDKTTLPAEGGEINVTFSPATIGTYTATITLTSAGAATKTISVTGVAESAIAEGLTKIWQNTTNVPGTAAGGDIRFAAVSNDKLLVNDKANNKILEINATGSSTYYNPEAVLTEHYGSGIGTLIACDDAGNILVNTDFPAATSGSNFTLISADLKSTYKIDFSTLSGFTALRTDQTGRIRGNMLSSEGAYVLLASSGATGVLIAKIKNGVIDPEYTQISANPGLELSTSTICQPTLATTAEFDALLDEDGDLSNSFYLRIRTAPNYVYAWNSDNSAMYNAWTFTNAAGTCTTANASVEGFDWFKLYDKSYFIMPVTTDGTTATRGSSFAIFDEDGNAVATWTEGQKAGIGAAMGSFIVVPNNDYSVYIYHFVPGTVAEKLCFAVKPQASSVENIEINQNINAPAEYYNLQGVKVAYPTTGIYIKVQGNNVSKIYVK